MKKTKLWMLAAILTICGAVSGFAQELTGSGTVDDPYLLHSQADWSVFAAKINSGEDADKCYKLADDWSQEDSNAVTVTVGTEEHPFTGTFDGGGHTLEVNINILESNGVALFHEISGGAVIKNLHVKGWTCGITHTAGLVGYSRGGSSERPNTIENCIVSTTVNSNTPNTLQHIGGVVGHATTSYLKLKDVVCNGDLGSQRDYIGGLVGWSDGNTLTLENCLFCGKYSTIIGEFDPIAVRDGGKTMTLDVNGAFYTVESTLTKAANKVVEGTKVSTTLPENQLASLLTLADGNNYYVSCTLSGLSRLYSLTTEAVEIGYTLTDGIEGSVLTEGTHFTAAITNGSGAAATTTLSEPGTYTVTLTGIEENGYAGTCATTIVVMQGDGSEDAPFLIEDTDGWNAFAMLSQNGERFSGKHVRLTADITVSTMAGHIETTINYGETAVVESGVIGFGGIFDGMGHTMTLDVDTSEEFFGPFVLSDGILRNIFVRGTLRSSGDMAGGLAGLIVGTNNQIYNCHSSVTLISTVSGYSDCGGLVGISWGAKLVLANCRFDGKLLTTTGATRASGLIGFLHSSLDISNCLSAPAEPAAGETAISDCQPFYRLNATSVTVNEADLYYLPTSYMNGTQGTDASTYTTKELLIHLGSTPWHIEEEVLTPVCLHGTLRGSGTTDYPYVLRDADDWKVLALNVAAGNTYKGKQFIMANDIDLGDDLSMVGTSLMPFAGHFDGGGHTLTVNYVSTQDCCAPFRYLSTDAHTFTRLTTAGTIKTSGKYAAGIIANFVWSSDQDQLFMSLCRSNISITTTAEGEAGAVGGLIGRYGAEMRIENCCYDGSLIGTSATHNGGLLASNRSTHTVFSYCLFNPFQLTVGNDNSYTLVRNDADNTIAPYINNCYNTCTLGTTQGIVGYQMTAQELVEALGTDNWTVENGMPIPKVTVAELPFWEGKGTAESPFLIATTDDLDEVARVVNTTEVGSTYYPQADGNVFYGYHFRMVNDLDYSSVTPTDGSNYTPIGYYTPGGGRIFSGTFDGDGHVVKGITISTTANSQGIFGFATGNISNLALAATTITGGGYTGGIAGYYSDGAITNCHVAADVTIGTPATTTTRTYYHGGIVGYLYSGSIEGSTSAATITDASDTGNCFGGIAGYNSGSITDCLYTGSTVSAATNAGAIVGYSNRILTNCYWANGNFTGTAIGAEGNSCNTTDVHGGMADDADNEGFLSTFTALQAAMTQNDYSEAFCTLAPNSVSLLGRTLYKDGSWNTLCLPFAMDATQIAASDLAGATIKELNTETSNLNPADGTLTLNFTTAYDPTDAPSGSIVAGRPYIVKWATTGDNISNPTFLGITISSTAPTAVEFAITGSSDKCQFVGQYSPFSIVASGATGSDQGNVNEIVMLGSGSKLGYSQNPRTLNCFRAHFYVPADPATGQALARRFVMDFGNGENTTGILTVTADTSATTAGIYTLDGRRLQAEPTEKGVYIVNGKKTIIK